MKIAFIGARGVPFGYSSAEQIALNIGKRLVARGHEFTVYCHSGLFEEHSQSYQGIKRVFLPTIEHRLFSQLVHGFASGIHAIFCDYDVVHMQCLTNTYQSILPYFVKRNIIINVDGPEWENPKWPKTLRQIFFKSAVYLTLAMCREIITDARGMYDIYVERYNRPSTIIEYGTEIVTPKNPNILDQYGLSPKEYYFIGARIVPSNKIDKSVEGFQRSGSDKILAIAGGGAYGSSFYQTLRKNAGNRVKFLGMISDQDHMDELYANAYGYIHGASMGGINSALLRPLGAGCPALAIDSPFNREVLDMGQNRLCGLIWNNVDQLSDEIRHLDSNPEMIRELSELSVIQVKRNFSWDLVTDQYEIFYKGFIEKWPVEKIRSEVAAQKDKYLTDR
jgi:glycosyltransferase involved in cell wall biosynthesis